MKVISLKKSLQQLNSSVSNVQFVTTLTLCKVQISNLFLLTTILLFKKGWEKSTRPKNRTIKELFNLVVFKICIQIL